MLFTTTSPIAGLSGKMGGDNGIVVSTRTGRGIARQMVIPDNPDTSAQQSIRNYLTLAAQAFQSLTPNEKAAWATLAAQVSRSDRLSQPYNPSAINIYCAVNLYRQIDGEAITDTAPAYTIQAAATAITEFTTDGTNLDLRFSHSNSDGFFVIRLSAPLASANRDARATDMRLATSTIADAIVARGASPQTFAPLLSALTNTLAEDNYAGIEILSLSAGYLPGQSLFVPSDQMTLA